jgi:putative membrane protein
MMNDIGFSGGGMGFGGFFMILFWGLIILGIIAAFKWIAGNDTGANGPAQKSALDILKERYARGEIDEQEFQQKRRDLEH